MVSPARIAANRVNAKKSTGPKTTEGKHVARFNALTHGLTATLALLPDEDPAALEQERTTSLQIYKPRNAVELAKVECAVYLSWQIGACNARSWRSSACGRRSAGRETRA